MTASVAVVGVSHRRTPAHLRERLHLTPGEAASLARSLAGEGREAVVLATCNRTELYLACTEIADAKERARCALRELGGRTVLASTVYVYADEDAAGHLFRVAAGLESIVLGDTDVAAQVRRAHAAARAAGATGALLDRLFEAASAASKRVRSETSLSRGSTSIPAAALAVAARVVGPLAERRVLVVGAGRIAQCAAFNAASRGCREIVVANRTFARAQELADRVGGRAVPLAELDAELATVDVVVSATGGRRILLRGEHAAAAATQRGGRPLAVFDLGLPRDVDPAFRDLHGLHLLDLDDLARIVAASGTARRAEVERADAVVRQEAENFEAWRRARAATPVIAALHGDAEEARRSVLARHAAGLARLAPGERALVETITKQLVAKLLHAPTLELRAATMFLDAL